MSFPTRTVPSLSSRAYTGSSCTGPKGVLEDYQLHLREQSQENREPSSRVYIREHPSINLQTQMSNRLGSSSSDSLKTLVSSRTRNSRGLEDDDDELDSVQSLTCNTFVSAIEDEDPSKTVIIHCYDSDIFQCSLTDKLLAALVPRYPCVKFYKLNTNEITDIMYFDQVALPGLLVYRNGNLFQCLLRIYDDIPEWRMTGTCSIAHFENYLIQHDIL